MKTVSELSHELHVSLQTIYRKLNKIDKNLTEKINGVTYITDAGVEALIECLTDVNQPLNSVEHEEINVKHVKGNDKHEENDEIIFLREQNRLLQQELIKSLEHSREQEDRIAGQSDRIVSLAEQLTELMRNNQILLGAEQSRTLLSSEILKSRPILSNKIPDQKIEKPRKKRGFFSLFMR